MRKLADNFLRHWKQGEMPPNLECSHVVISWDSQHWAYRAEHHLEATEICEQFAHSQDWEDWAEFQARCDFVVSRFNEAQTI